MIEKTIEEKLLIIFNNVNDWLKFAEAKNAVLIGFIGAALIGVFSSWTSLNPEHQLLIKYIFFPIEICALLVSFYSFLPDLKLFERTSKKKSKKSRKDGINLYFFGHLKDLTKEHLLKELYNPSCPEKFSRFELDLAYQITINSDITWKKYIAFKLSGYLSLTGIILTIAGLLILC